MLRKNYLILLLFLFLSDCTTRQTQLEYFDVLRKNNKNYIYRTLSCPTSDITGEYWKCYIGKSNVSQLESNRESLEGCKKNNFDCAVVKENDNYVFNIEAHNKLLTKNKIDNYIAQCEYIGFKRNTDKMGECVLKISQTETQIVNNKSGSDNSLVNLLILQESLKLLNPPVQPNRNIRCNYNTVGGIGSVNCF